jgi:hypothetical protein
VKERKSYTSPGRVEVGGRSAGWPRWGSGSFAGGPGISSSGRSLDYSLMERCGKGKRPFWVLVMMNWLRGIGDTLGGPPSAEDVRDLC